MLRIKAFLEPYLRQKDYEFHLAHNMFVANCKAQRESQFTQFLAIATTTD
jgi:hypothetical protein